jgi:hypothetical protein
VLAALLLTGAAAGNDRDRRDPTRPGKWAPVAEAGAEVALPRLTSVLIGESRKLAVIDGQVLGVGESHGGFRVQRIAADHVMISVTNGSLVRLPLDSHDMNKEIR